MLILMRECFLSNYYVFLIIDLEKVCGTELILLLLIEAFLLYFFGSKYFVL